MFVKVKAIFLFFLFFFEWEGGTFFVLFFVIQPWPGNNDSFSRTHTGHLFIRHILDRVERGARQGDPGGDHHAQLLHHLQQVGIIQVISVTISPRFRSNLPVVSNLTAMNMWDGVCMFFIYASFIEFILVNYLARWVQDPEQQKKKRENAILDVSNNLSLQYDTA